MTPDEIIVDESQEATNVETIDFVADKSEEDILYLSEWDFITPNKKAIINDNVEWDIGSLCNDTLVKVLYSNSSDEWTVAGVFTSNDYRVRRRHLKYFNKVDYKKIRKDRDVYVGDNIKSIAGFCSKIVIIKDDYIIMTKWSKIPWGDKESMVKFSMPIFWEQFVKGNWYFSDEKVPVVSLESIKKYLPKHYVLRWVSDCPYIYPDNMVKWNIYVSRADTTYMYLWKMSGIHVLVAVDYPSGETNIDSIVWINQRKSLYLKKNSKVEFIEFDNYWYKGFPIEITKEKIAERMGISVDIIDIDNGNIEAWNVNDTLPKDNRDTF